MIDDMIREIGHILKEYGGTIEWEYDWSYPDSCPRIVFRTKDGEERDMDCVGRAIAGTL